VLLRARRPVEELAHRALDRIVANVNCDGVIATYFLLGGKKDETPKTVDTVVQASATQQDQALKEEENREQARELRGAAEQQQAKAEERMSLAEEQAAQAKAEQAAAADRLAKADELDPDVDVDGDRTPDVERDRT